MSRLARKLLVLAATVGVAWMLQLAACFELPPTIPPGYVGSEVEPPWPPLAVYHRDPFHPANVLFHRLYQLHCEQPCGDVPLAARDGLTALDRAEIAALAWQILPALGAQAPAEEALPPTGRTLLARDVKRLLRQLEPGPPSTPADEPASPDVQALRKLLEVTQRDSLPWPPLPEGALAGDGEELPDAHPLPAAPDMTAWRLDGDRAVVEELRRARWLRGESPWVTLGDDDPTAAKLDREVRFGTREELCGDCHE